MRQTLYKIIFEISIIIILSAVHICCSLKFPRDRLLYHYNKRFCMNIYLFSIWCQFLLPRAIVTSAIVTRCLIKYLIRCFYFLIPNYKNNNVNLLNHQVNHGFEQIRRECELKEEHEWKGGFHSSRHLQFERPRYTIGEKIV